MSVDETIRELSGTIAQLGLLVGKINEQIGGISSRINLTLQNFDDSVAGIAKDANKMTEQVDNTIAQVPGSWAFYLLFFTLILVLVLLSILIIISLVLKIQSICILLRGESSRASTPLQSLVHSEYKQPLHSSVPFQYGKEHPSSRHIAVEMEHEPRRFGLQMAPQFPHPTSHSTQKSHSTLNPVTIYHSGREYYRDGNGGTNITNSDAELRERSPRSQEV